MKRSASFKNLFYKEVYETNFSFAYVNNIYQKLFGSPIPFSKYIKEPVQETFKETLTFKEKEAYEDGVKLTVEKNYLVPIKNSGLVVFIGEKENLGNTVIIQGIDGIDYWYSNVENLSVNLYDYTSKGDYLGTSKDNKLFLTFKKENDFLEYDEVVK